MKYEYFVKFNKEPNGKIAADVPDLGIHTFGDDILEPQEWQKTIHVLM